MNEQIESKNENKVGDTVFSEVLTTAAFLPELPGAFIVIPVPSYSSFS